MRRYDLGPFISLGIVVATAAVFWNVLGAGFVAWDDNINIYENELITKLDAQHIATMFMDVEKAMRYKPVSWLTWGTIYTLSGLKPFAYHLANLLLHCGNALLVFLIIGHLLLLNGRLGYSAGNRNRLLLCAGVGALLWAIHPLRVETVAWATALPYNLSLLFVLVSFHCYLRVDRAETENKRLLYWGSVLTFALALLSYPIVLGFPLVLLVLDYYRSLRVNGGPVRWWNKAGRRIWLEKTPFLLASGLFTGIALYGRIRPEGRWAEPVSVEEFGLVPRAMQASYIWAYFLWKPYSPTDLSPVYTTLLSFHPTDVLFLSSMALVVGLSFLVFWYRRKWPAAYSLWICHLVLLIPVLGLTEHPHFPSDRYGILAGILWPILIAAGLFKFSARGRAKGIVVTASVVVLAGLGWMSRAQVRIWNDDIALFSYAAEKTADSAMGNVMRARLAVAQLQRGQFSAALENLQGLLEAQPENPDYLQNTAFALLHMNRFQESVNRYLEALRLNPSDAGLHNAAGIALAAAGDLKEAERQFDEALRIDPRLADAQFNLGVILSRQGRTNEATVLLEKARAMHLSPTK
jgi:predicted negative regulator of RcsB-dependent stress response